MTTSKDLHDGADTDALAAPAEPSDVAAPVLASHANLPTDAEGEARSQWKLIVGRFLRHRLAVACLLVLIAMYAVCSLPHIFAPYSMKPSPLSSVGPSLKHYFGTDEIGHDEFTLSLSAAHLSMTIGLLVAIFSTLIGTFIGAVAGYFGGWVDQALMRFTDLFLVVPGIAIVAMIQSGLSGKSLPLVGKVSTSNLIIGAMSVLFWQTIARVVRGLFLSIKEKEYVEAARASGASSWRIMFRHILPNVMGPIVVNATLVVAYAILLESALSFLGLGVKPPAVSLGAMLNDAENSVGTRTAYLIYFPGLILLVIVLCVNFVGDGLRDALDPQSQKH